MKTQVTVDMAAPVKLVARGIGIILTPFRMVEAYAAEQTVIAAVKHPAGQAKLAELIAQGINAQTSKKASK